MKRTEFRKLKMFDKLNYIKQSVLNGDDKTTICLMLDECIYKTGEYMKGTSQRADIFTKDELDTLRAKERSKMATNSIRKLRWKTV